MADENPEYALAIVSEIPSQMGDVEGLMERARKSIDDAENEISSSDSESIAEFQQRLEEAKEALERGNPSLAIGLSDGVTRSLREEAEAKTAVQRALRQRKSIEEKSLPEKWARNGGRCWSRSHLWPNLEIGSKPTTRCSH